MNIEILKKKEPKIKALYNKYTKGIWFNYKYKNSIYVMDSWENSSIVQNTLEELLEKYHNEYVPLYEGDSITITL